MSSSLSPARLQLLHRQSCVPVLMSHPCVKPTPPIPTPPHSPAILPSTNTTPFIPHMHVTMTRHTIISFASPAQEQLSLSQRDVFAELAGRPLFRFVHDPDLVSLLRCLSHAQYQPLQPISCFIRWRSPWEQRFARTELQITLLADYATFDIVLKRAKPEVPVVITNERRIVRVAQIKSYEDCVSRPYSPSCTPLRNRVDVDDSDDDSSSADSEDTFVDVKDSPKQPITQHPQPKPLAGQSVSGTLKLLMEQTLPTKVSSVCAQAIDSVEAATEKVAQEESTTLVTKVVGFGVELGREASWRVWDSVCKRTGW